MSATSLLKTSLQFKVAAVLLAVLICAAGVAGLFSVRWIGNWLNLNTTLESANTAEILAAISADALSNRDHDELETIAARALNYGNIVGISLLNADGTSAATRISHRAEVALLPIEPESVSLAYERHLGPQRLLIARPVLTSKSGDAVVGAIRLAIDTTSTQQMLKKATIMTWSLAGVVVLCIFPLANLMLRKLIITPVHRLAAATRRLAAGDYSARSPQFGCNDDIAVLAESFNLMAERIESQHRQLMEANENLEGKVRRRTGQLDRANTRLRSQMDEHLKFLRAVSHDLNAPLRNIAGIADLTIMKWANELPDEVKQRLQRIRANVTTESELINDLLEISRLGTAPVRSENIDLAEMLSQMKSDFEYDLQRKNMQMDIDDDMPTVYADANHMRKLFQNLIDNAIKYMPANRQDAQVSVTWQLDSECYHFYVTDNGCGIDADDREKIFTVFRRGRETGNEPGKGVGLAGVAAIAARYEGSVSVDGQAGRGSSFHVCMNRKILETQPENGKNNASEPDTEEILSGSGS